MIEERLDVAMHVGQPTDSSLMARAAGAFGRTLVAAPIYLERRGAPTRPADLTRAHLPDPRIRPGQRGVALQRAGRAGGDPRHRPFRANNAEVVHRAVLAGYGVAHGAGGADRGRYPRGAAVPAAAEATQSGRLPAFVLYPSRRHLAPRTRVVIDFLVEQLIQASARLAQDDVWGDNDTVWLV